MTQVNGGAACARRFVSPLREWKAVGANSPVKAAFFSGKLFAG
jgi:hypothetical protein